MHTHTHTHTHARARAHEYARANARTCVHLIPGSIPIYWGDPEIEKHVNTMRCEQRQTDRQTLDNKERCDQRQTETRQHKTRCD